MGAGVTNSRGTLVIDVGTISYSGTTNPTSTSIGPTSLNITMLGENPFSTAVSVTSHQTITVNMTNQN